MSRRFSLCLLSALVLFALKTARGGDAPPVPREQAIAAMRKATAYWAKTVASHGGYVWEYSTDLTTRRRGESKDLPLSTVWIQAGTPMVGEAYLAGYEATKEPLFLDAALETGRCLAWGQLESGGWTYCIEFDPKRNLYWYHHLGPAGKKLRNTTTFDDDNTQSATRFLMPLDRFVDDPKISAAIDRALRCFLEAQYKGGNWDGAWPQRYPPPKKNYGRLPTYNDNTMSDCVRTMLAAWKQYRRREYLDSVKRCLEFYLRSQQPPPQAAWAQQYNEKLEPAWARRFEPPAITGCESCGNCRLLLDMFIEFGDARYLEAVGKCVDWYRRSRIGGTPQHGIWARFYEPGTNKPLYFTRTYKLTYDDSDLPVHYSFKGDYGVNTMRNRYRYIRDTARNILLARRDHTPTPKECAARARRLEAGIRAVISAQDALGRWVKKMPKIEQKRDKKGRVYYEKDKNTILDMMYTRTFAANLRLLARYVAALDGAKATPPN